VLAEFPLRRRLSIIFSLNGTVIDSPSYRYHDTENLSIMNPLSYFQDRWQSAPGNNRQFVSSECERDRTRDAHHDELHQ